MIQDGQKETAYHCTATWHLARLSRAAEEIYSLANVIGKKSKKFFCSAGNVADYLGYERRQIYRGLQDLEDAGFLELESRRNFQTSIYRIVPHKEWAEKHPGQCATKQALPWDGEGDELGPKMFALSGGRHKFLEYEIKLLRNCGLSEDLILSEWADFIARWKPLNRQDQRYAFSRFYDVLKVKRGTVNRLEGLIFTLYQMSGYVFSGGYKNDLSWLVRHYSDQEITHKFSGHLVSASETSWGIRAFCEEARQEQVEQILSVRETRRAAVLPVQA